MLAPMLLPILAETVTPTTQAITFATVGGFFTLVTLLVTNRSKHAIAATLRIQHEQDEAARREEKATDLAAAIAKDERDWARQDIVQARTEAVAAHTMAKLNDVEKLGIVTHGLVNSDRTALLRDKRDNLITTQVLMREVTALKVAQGIPPTAEGEEMMSVLTKRIEQLGADIEDRLRQQDTAERQVAVDEKKNGTQP